MYQAEFSLEDNTVVVNNAFNYEGKTFAVAIKQLNSQDLSELGFKAWCDFCNIAFANEANILEYYEYYYNDNYTALYGDDELYVSVARELFAAELMKSYSGSDERTPTMLILPEADGEGWVGLDKADAASIGLSKAKNASVTKFAQNNNSIKIDNKNFTPDNSTRFVFATRDGVYTYSGVPMAGVKLNINENAYYGVNGNIFTVFDPDHCLTDVAKGSNSLRKTLTDISRVYEKLDHDCSEYITDNTYECDVILRTMTSVWDQMNRKNAAAGTNPIERIMISKGDASTKLNIGDTIALTAEIIPGNAEHGVLSWSTSDKYVATVDSNGTVTALSAGETEITLNTVSGYTIFKTSIFISVDDTPKIQVGSALAYEGSTVRIPISIANNPGFAGLKLSISYDKSTMTLEDIEYGDWVATDNLGHMSSGDPLNLLFVRAGDYTENGVLAYLVFKLNNELVSGYMPEKYSISVTAYEAINQTPAFITLTVVDGYITVMDGRVGDTNGDGDISTADAVLLAQYLAGWSVSVSTAVADCNGDGEISTADAVLLAQYLAGWQVTLG